jgi:transcriptional regulator with XRE-family HTH domain
VRTFESIAILVRTKRLAHNKKYSQSDLSKLLGYKNGQFISNVERGLCSIPLKMLTRLSTVLEISKEDIKLAVLKDYEKTIEEHLT